MSLAMFMGLTLPSASALALGRAGRFAAQQRFAARGAVQMAADGPVCIVTGGSRGLGRAIALSLGKEGCRVVVNYAASAAAAEAVVEEIKGLGGDGVAVQADMSSPEGINTLFKATADAFDDPVGVLVNNAGITRDTLILRMKQQQWEDVINTNLNGVFYASQAAAMIDMIDMIDPSFTPRRRPRLAGRRRRRRAARELTRQPRPRFRRRPRPCARRARGASSTSPPSSARLATRARQTTRRQREASSR